MDISDFDFTLPDRLIAQHPPEVRGSSRLLVALPDMPLQDRVFGVPPTQLLDTHEKVGFENLNYIFTKQCFKILLI